MRMFNYFVIKYYGGNIQELKDDLERSKIGKDALRSLKDDFLFKDRVDEELAILFLFVIGAKEKDAIIYFFHLGYNLCSNREHYKKIKKVLNHLTDARKEHKVHRAFYAHEVMRKVGMNPIRKI